MQKITHLKKAATFPAESPNTIPCEQASQLVLQAKEYLNSVQSNGWADFADKMGEVDESFLRRCRVFLSGHTDEFTLKTMPNREKVVDKRFEKDALIPYGLAPLTATGNGDCLFNSVGKLLFGTEVISPILRLVAAAEGIRHWRHYVEEYCERFLTRDCALQMLYSMSTPGVYENRPSFSRATAPDVLKYTIQSEIMEITKEKSFSGLLHMRFLATVLGRSINTHCSFSEFFHGLMIPCLCCCSQLNEAINVMFVSVGKSPFPNHYIPLVWKVGKEAPAPSLKASVKERMCAASKKLGCHALVGEKEEWVFCKRCKLCYHAVCSGVNANRKSFICCIDKATKDAIKNDINAIVIHFDDTFRCPYECS
eukprot:gene2768-3201_t